MQFSIIIPIYNVEQYLTQCIDSVLQQSFNDYEIILVDDGSTDTSGSICDKYALKNKFIKVLHIKNGGSSHARNFGLSNASGKYIIFLDSDDYWDNDNALAELNNIIEKYHSEVIIFGCKDLELPSNKISVSKGYYGAAELNLKPKHKILTTICSQNNFPGGAWLFAVKRDLLINSDIYFITGNTAEDFDWITKVIYLSSQISLLDTPFYVHRMKREGSITSQPKASGIKGILDAIDNWISINNMDYPYIDSQLAFAFIQSLIIFNNISSADQKKCGKRMIDSMIILKRNYFYKLIFFFIKIAGIKNTSSIMAKLYHLYSNFRHSK